MKKLLTQTPCRLFALTVVLLLLSLSGWSQVRFSVKLQPNGQYLVSLRADAGSGSGNRFIGTGQITLKVPTSATDPFSISNVTTSDYSSSGIASINAPVWVNNAIVRAPSQSPGFDYFLIAVTTGGSAPFAAGVETPLFTFDNLGGCTGAVEVWATGDPFSPNPPTQPINVGNEMSVPGMPGDADGNIWFGNVNPGQANCLRPTVAILTPALNSTVTTTTPTLSGTATPGSTVTLTASNGGTTTVQASPTGAWSTSAITFVPGPHSVTAITGDVNGISDPATTSFTYDDRGAFACAGGSVSGNFIANGVGSQSGTLSLNFTTTTPGAITLTASGAGIASSLISTTLAAGQNSLSIPLTYDGLGMGGVRTVNVTSSMSTGTCSATVLVGQRPSVAIDSPTNTTASTTPTISGTATPGSDVVVTTGPAGSPTTLCTTTASISGAWSCNVNLTDGPQTVTATANNPNGTSDPVTTSFTVVTPVVVPLCVAEYKVELLPGNIYSVKIRPGVSYSGSQAQVTTGQVTLMAPANSLTLSSFVSTAGSWSANTIVRQPSQNPGMDYFLVGLTGVTSSISFVAGQEVELFRFQNAAPCAGAVRLMENTGDPFAPSATQTVNAGQEMAVAGYEFGGENAWCANYGGPTAPAVLASPTLTSSTATICNTSSVTLSASGSTPGATYSWSGPGLAQTTGAQVVATPGIEGTASYSVVAVLNSCSSVAASTQVLSTSAACPPTVGAFACTGSSISGNFVANGMASQSGTLLLGINTTTPGPVTLTAAGTGIGSTPTVFSATLIAGQNNLSVPLTYDGLGMGGVRTVNVTSSMSTGTCSATVLVGELPTVPSCIVEYKVELLPGNIYSVKMRPGVSYSGSQAQVTTGQVTLMAPANSLTLSGFVSTAGSWSANTIVRQPSQNPGMDYFLVGLTGVTSGISFVAGQEVELFRFQNVGPCAGAVRLMENTGDPFAPSATQTVNAGQEMAIAGYEFGGENAWCANYGGPTAPAVLALPTLTSSTATICNTSSVTLSASGSVAGATYSWSGPGLAQTTGAQVVATPGIEGTASYSVVAVLSSCTSVAASTQVLSTSAACPPTVGTFACTGSTISGNFVANGNAGQSGTLLLGINTTTPGPVTLTAAGTGIGSTPTVFSATLVAGQNSIAIPLTYNGTGLGGVRPVNVTSSMGTGTCSATVAIGIPVSVTNSGPCTIVDCGVNVRYGLKLGADGVTYTVYMLSASPLSGTAAQIATAQVTVKLPIGTTISSLTNMQANTAWSPTTPIVTAGSLYYSFGLQQTIPFTIPSNVEIPLFSFRRTNPTCLGEVALWNTGDVYSFPNAFNTNPANQITIAGYGSTINGNGNAWACNYTCPVVCPSATLTLVKLAPGIAQQGTAFSYTMVVTNTGSGPTNGVINVADVLPAGMTFVGATGNGWAVSQQAGQAITVSTSTPLLAGANSSFVITVNPTLAGTFPNSATLTGGGSATAIVSAPCAACPTGPTIINVLPAQTDLAISIQMPTILAAGVGNTVTLTLTNLSGVATGPQTVSLVMPNGLTAPALFAVNGGWTCSTATGLNSNQVVTCQNPASLSAGQTMTLPISVTPASTLIGNYVVLVAQAAQAPGELNLANNVAITAATLIQGADLALTFGTLPLMPPNTNAIVAINITNVGAVTVPNTLTVNVTLPADVAVNTAFLSGWTFIGSAPGLNGTTIVTLTNANAGGLAQGGLLTLNLPLTVGPNAASVLNFAATVVPVASELITVNNTSTASTNGGRPDLIVTVTGPNPAFIVNQTSNVLVTITNIGTAAATGPFTTTVSMPAGYVVNTAAGPTGLPLGWSIQSSGNDANGRPYIVLVNNATSLAIGQSVSVSLPFTPGTVNANITGTFLATVAGAPTEVILSNNLGFLYATPTNPGIQVVVNIPTTFTAGVSSDVTVIFTNNGTAPYGGLLTTQVTLNNYLTVGTLPAGWVITNTVLNPNGTTTYTFATTTNISLAINNNITLVFPVTPAITSGGQSATITVVTPVYPIVIGGSTVTVTQIVQILAPPTPNVVVVVTTNTTVINVGQTTIINVVFTNNGNGVVNGPISTTFSLPSGMTIVNGQLPGGWVITNTVTINNTTVYTITNSTVFIGAGGGTLNLNIPVFVFQPIVVVVQPTINVFVQVVNQVIINQFTYILPQVVYPNIQLFVNQPVMVVNQTSILSATVINNGTGGAFGPLTVNVTLPAGVTLVNAQLTLPSGWLLIGNVNNVLTFQTPNTGGFAVGNSVVLNLPIVGGVIVANTTININVTVLQVLGQTTSVTQVVVINVPALNRPDLIISAAQPLPILTVNQSSSIAVTITNIGSVSATGPISFQMGVPAGMTVNAAALTGGWAVQSITANFDGSSTYTFINSSLAGIGVSQPIATNIVVVPGATLANATMNLGLFVIGVTNELNIANNGFTLIISTPVQPAPVPDQAVVIPQPSFTLAVGQVSLLSFNVNNIGTAGTTGSLSLTFTMPQGFTTSQSTFITGNWACQTLNNRVVCTNVVGLTLNAASSLTIPVVPMAIAGGMLNPVFQIQVAQTAGETVLLNNFGTIQYIGVVAAPDLAVSFPSPSFTLTAGQPANVVVLVSNVSTLANAVGPISLTFSMPQGFAVSQNAFTSNGWSCTSVGTQVSCLYAGGLNAGASLTMVVPVVPPAGAINPSFVAIVGAAPGELNLLNNIAQLFYNGPVLSAGVAVAVKAVLQGPYNEATGLMNDNLRQRNLIPLTHPFASLQSAASWVLTANPATTAGVLSVTGSNAIVDWVMVELRSTAAPNGVLAGMPALIQRDGDVVSALDGVSSLTFTGINAGNYYVVLRHRNHLGVMSRLPVTLSSTSTASVDFTNVANAFVKTFNTTVATAPLHESTNSLTQLPNPAMLWAGDTDGNGMVIFQGNANDLVPIFTRVMFDPANTGSLSNFIASGYDMTDVNLDGSSIFQGPDNEVNTIFFNILDHKDNGNRFSNFIILQHLP